MPTYDYVCDHCGSEFELFQSMKESPVQECPQCHVTGEVRRLIGTGAGIIFKGSGFYETDYKRKSYSPSGEGKTNGQASTVPESSSAKSESPKESKKEPSTKEAA
ncbi:MAG: FmdB family zinc ribbon protein [bacterium]